MASKKYYWLKLKTDFFNQREIKKLRKIAGGDTFTIIYLKMQLLSIKHDGVIKFEGTEAHFDEQLALELDEELENVRLTLTFLHSNMLIEPVSNADYLFPKVCELIGSESDSAERVRRHRNGSEQKALQCNAGVTECNAVVTTCNTEIEKELEKEIDKKKKTVLSAEVESFFETCWEMMPIKKGKGRVSNDAKMKVFKMGDVFIECISAFKKDMKGREPQYIPHGSTFFNSGYIDYVKSAEQKKPATELIWINRGDIDA